MTTLTVKASNAFAAVGKDLASQSQGASLFTVKHKQGDVTATLEFNDKTVNDPASLMVRSGCCNARDAVCARSLPFGTGAV